MSTNAALEPGPQTQPQPMSPVRVVVTMVVLAGAGWSLGSPPRPTLPVGAVDATAITDFTTDGLRLVITVSIWYLLAALTLAGLARIRGPGGPLRPWADRLLDIGAGALLRRALASSAAVGVAVPGAAAAEAPTVDADDIPVMTPIDEVGTGVDDAGTGTAPSAVDGWARSAADRFEAQPPPAGPTPPQMRVRPSTSSTQPAEGRIDTPSHAEDTRHSRTDPTSDNGTGRTPRTAPGQRAAASPLDPPSMRRLPPPAGSSADTSGVAVIEPRRDGEDGGGPRHGHTPAQHTVEAGESFWTIAETLATTGSEPPATAAIAAVWQQLVDLNAADLVDPGNPDLIHTGQVINLGILG